MDPCPSGTFSYTIRPGDTLWDIAQRFHIDIDDILRVNHEIRQNILYIGQVICIPVNSAPGLHGMSISESGLSKHLRMLWEQHVFWTRLFIISAVFDLPDLDVVTNRLLRNPKDFAEALSPIYGEAIASKFSDLLTNHLTIAAQLVKAAKAHDNNAAAQAEKQWYTNANEIAAFLAQINPYWSEQEWRRLLHMHLAMTKQEAVDYLNHDYAASVSTFDNIEREALEMADVMTNGIVKQFSNYIVA